MLNTCRVPLTDRKVKEKRAMKQHKAMIVALIVICITAVVEEPFASKPPYGARVGLLFPRLTNPSKSNGGE